MGVHGDRIGRAQRSCPLVARKVTLHGLLRRAFIRQANGANGVLAGEPMHGPGAARRKRSSELAVFEQNVKDIPLCRRSRVLLAALVQVLYKKLGAKLAVGMPFKDIATSDSVVMRELPPSSDKEGRRALRRLQVG